MTTKQFRVGVPTTTCPRCGGKKAKTISVRPETLEEGFKAVEAAERRRVLASLGITPQAYVAALAKRRGLAKRPNTPKPYDLALGRSVFDPPGSETTYAAVLGGAV